jgi:hypothetical protein
VRNISLLPIGSHIKGRGIKPYGFDYKIGDWIQIQALIESVTLLKTQNHIANYNSSKNEIFYTDERKGCALMLKFKLHWITSVAMLNIL